MGRVKHSGMHLCTHPLRCTYSPLQRLRNLDSSLNLDTQLSGLRCQTELTTLIVDYVMNSLPPSKHSLSLLIIKVYYKTIWMLPAANSANSFSLIQKCIVKIHCLPVHPASTSGHTFHSTPSSETSVCWSY